MTDLPESLFANPVLHALQTRHRHFAVSTGEACRYPADVAPFAAVARPSKSALQISSLAPRTRRVRVAHRRKLPPRAGTILHRKSRVFPDGAARRSHAASAIARDRPTLQRKRNQDGCSHRPGIPWLLSQQDMRDGLLLRSSIRRRIDRDGRRTLDARRLPGD
jgi:hypothetical protein